LLFVCCFFRFSCTDVPLNFRSRWFPKTPMKL
jgi:hypothetical protein